MKAFFAGMNLARGILLFSLLGALVLGWLGWQRGSQVRELRTQLAAGGGVETRAGELMRMARQHTKLSREARADLLVGQNDPETYIRGVAAADRVNIGDVRLTPRDVATGRGTVDKTYDIRPSPERPFARSLISNFLYKLEADSRRIKVTRIRIEKSEPRLKPHEIPKDEWVFDATVTSRQGSGG